MLEVILDEGRQPLACDDYVLTQCCNGQDTVSLTISRQDPAVQLLTERARVYETTTRQTFLVAAVDAGQSTVTYALSKDLSDWERVVYPSYTNGSAKATAEDTIRGVLPEGWTLDVEDTDTLAAYISLQGPTALEVVEQCGEVYDCAVTYDNRTKTATLHFPGKKQLGQAFLVDTANLREAPEYKSKTGDLVTRLYVQGADGLSFADINGGKSYVECFDYTDEIIAGFWRDDRYTVAEHLLAAAKEKVKSLGQPERSWTVSMCDLQGIDPETWPGLGFALYDVIRLVDGTLGQTLEAQVTELRTAPHYPERNEMSITNVSGTLGTTTAARLLRQAQGTAYQDLLLTVDQVKVNLANQGDTMETIRKTADGAQTQAASAVTATSQIANGTYTTGSFISGNRLYSPEICAQELKISSSDSASYPKVSFYPKDGSDAMLELGSSGNSMQGYNSFLWATADMIFGSDYALILKPGKNVGESGYSGVAVEGDLYVSGGISGSVKDYVTAQGSKGIWTYRKWNSGLAECWGRTDGKSVTPVAAGSLYRTADGVDLAASQSFPFTFKAEPMVQVTGTAGAAAFPKGSGSTTGTAAYGGIWATNPGTVTVQAVLYAVGTWK